MNAYVVIYLIIIITTDTSGFWNNDEKENNNFDEVKSDKVNVKNELGTVIGIDLGTTYSCVAVFKSCHVEVIENDQGNRITPSYVTFTSNGERLIGDAAKNLLTSNPQNTIFHMKRLIGREYDDPSVQQDIKYFPFSVLRKDDKPVIKVKTAFGEKLFTPEEISAMILGKMRDIAEIYLGKKVKNAVVTVPAYFNDAQRQATKDAGTIAGLNVIRIINEPTAAAIAYGLDKFSRVKSSKTVLVYDLGGGTFDVSLLTFDDGIFQVIATSGNTHLGGEDFDLRVMEHFIELFKMKKGKDIRGETRALQKLRREVEKAKRILSSETETKIEIESFFRDEDFNEILTRSKFEELNIDLFRLTLKPVEKVLADGDLKKYDIDEIILVGGSTKIPKIRQIIKKYFNGKEPSRNINPDEVVAYGAAIQGAILSDEDCTEDITVLDVNPLTLGIETKGGTMSKIIQRNSVIPIKKTEKFTTTIDDQTTVNIQIFEGERPMTKDNHFLGQFELTGILRQSKGTPSIEVTFQIDVNGILKVTAEDKTTGNKKAIVINSDTKRLLPKEIDTMIHDAEIFAEQDKKIKNRVDTRNNFESYIYLLKNQLAKKNKLYENLSLEEKVIIENAIEDQIKWLESNPDAKITQLKVHKKQLENIVSSIMDKFHKETDDSNEIPRPSHEHNEDL